MRSKIIRGMVIVMFLTLLISVLILAFAIERNSLSDIQKEVKLEAEYVAIILNETNRDNAEVVQTLFSDNPESRATLIDKNGTVLYDSEKDYREMENHGDRDEIIETLKSGKGDGERLSSTTLIETYYYAVLLENEDILRISKTTESALVNSLEILPWAIGIGVVVFIITIIISRSLVKNLLKPLEKIDLDNPLEHETYIEIRPLLERIDESNQERDKGEILRKEFTANVSHELKTPLTSISGYAEIMKNGMVPPEDIEPFAEKIYTEANRLIRLIEDILKISRLDEGGLNSIKEEVELYSMMRDIISRLSIQAEEKNIKVTLVGEPVNYIGVKHILDEILYNIYENAIKYNIEKGSINVWVGSTLEGAKVIISDTGIGILPDDKERIFERFYRADKSHSKTIGGTGLGLSIVKHGANLHNIKVEVESKVGEGTTVELNFSQD